MTAAQQKPHYLSEREAKQSRLLAGSTADKALKTAGYEIKRV